MNERSLADQLNELAEQLENSGTHGFSNVWDIAQELRKLASKNYAPGNSVSWSDIKPKSTKKLYTDKQGRKLPF